MPITSHCGHQAPPVRGGAFLRFVHVRSLVVPVLVQISDFSFMALSVHRVQGPWAAQEGPIERLLAKVKNASGRIGIFWFFILDMYLLFVMVISMLALLASIVVLAMHHHSNQSPVPEWMKRFLRISNTATTVETIKFNREHKAADISKASTEEAILLRTILQELKILNKCKDTDTEGDWQKAAKQMDCIFFWIFFVFIFFLNLYFLLSHLIVVH